MPYGDNIYFSLSSDVFQQPTHLRCLLLKAWVHPKLETLASISASRHNALSLRLSGHPPCLYVRYSSVEFTNVNLQAITFARTVSVVWDQ